jgi:hypothetical protein
MKKDSYEKDLEINPNGLQSEWERQAPLYMYYAKEAAKLEMERDFTKEAMEVVRAELDAKIRENPAEFTKAPKLTESIVGNIITEHKRYREAYSKYIESKYSHTILSSAVKAFEHKKKALENLVMLSLHGLYAEPKEKQTLLKGRRLKKDNQ